MKQENMRWALVLAFFVQGCALDAAEPTGQDAGDPGASKPAPPVSALSHSCERVDELGLAAQGIRLHASHVDAVEAPCISLAEGRIASLGNRACRLVAPTGFALNGCFDSYDCGGCPVVVRSDTDFGFTVAGESTSLECADIAAKYALVPGPVCDAQVTLDQR